MAMSLGNRGGPQAQINMTPMIDVLLVLIIIFMVIAPTKSVGLNTLLPQQSTSVDRGPSHEIVISILADGSILLNQEPIGRDRLEARLIDLFKSGGSTPVFIKGDRTLEYSHVTDVIDIAHRAGIGRIGLM